MIHKLFNPFGFGFGWVGLPILTPLLLVVYTRVFTVYVALLRWTVEPKTLSLHYIIHYSYVTFTITDTTHRAFKFFY